MRACCWAREPLRGRARSPRSGGLGRRAKALLDRGVAGELWYARVLPPPFPELDEHVVFTTPYVLIDPSEAEWLAYFDRNLPNGSKPARLKAHRKLMKCGPASDYWNEFVFRAYHHHQQDAIFLTGIPDMKATLPHV